MPIDQKAIGLWPAIASNIISVNTHNLSASTSALEFIFQATSTEPITHLGVFCSALVGTTPTYKISIQGVNTAGTASGFPDGTIKGGASPASKTFNPSSLGWTASTFQWLALDNSYTPTVGELLSYVIIYDSGTVDTSNYLRVGEALSSVSGGLGLPRVIVNTTGTRTHRTGQAVGGWRTANGRYGGGNLFAFAAASNIALTSERAVKFTVPSTISTTKLAAIQWVPSNSDPTSNITIKGYAGGNTTDTTSAWTDTLLRYVNSAFNMPLVYWLVSPWTLSGGSTYRVSFSASGANMYYADVTESADWQTLDQQSAWSDAGISYSTRSGGNWTDTATRRLNVNLWFSNTTYAGGSAGVRSVNIRGGADQ